MVNARQRLPARGFALLVVLIAIAAAGAVAAYSVQVGSQVSRKDAEDALLDAGLTLQRALRSYVDSSPGQTVLGPRSLNELLKDPRFPATKRHLRQIPIDPLTGKADWVLVLSPDDQVIAVHSAATGTPIKRTGFSVELAHIVDAQRYSDWRFGAALRPAATSASAPAR